MATPRHQLIDANGIRLHVVDQGSGPAVLFCHGYPSTWFGWRQAMRAVANAGFHAIALDIHRYGDSDTPDASDLYTPFHTVDKENTEQDHFKDERAILVGHDFGASVTWN